MKLRAKLMRGLGLPVLLAALAACAGGGETVASAPLPAEQADTTGPAADYPMVLGDPFTIDGVIYTPSDALNVDEVGFASADAPDVDSITAAHRTLPMPSYVEVTALDSGRTALVRVERRGPMTNDRLIALSAGALRQLGIGEGAPVRVRRVNPPEEDRAELRRGKEAPLRMSTPAGLLEVLRRQLPAKGSTSLQAPPSAKTNDSVPVPGAIKTLDPDSEATTGTADAVPEKPTPELSATTPLPSNPVLTPDTSTPEQFVIQIGTFAVHENAKQLAAKLGGHIKQSGQLALVRIGPYASRGQADQALAKLRGEGYSDARITTLM